MSRYIDADALIDNLELMYEHRDDKDEPYNIGVRGAINMARKAPTIEPKRGEWKPFDLIHDYDWYVSGDTCEETYLKAKAAFKKKWLKYDEKRVQMVIDNAIDEARQELYKTYGVDPATPE